MTQPIEVDLPPEGLGLPREEIARMGKISMYDMQWDAIRIVTQKDWDELEAKVNQHVLEKAVVDAAMEWKKQYCQGTSDTYVMVIDALVAACQALYEFRHPLSPEEILLNELVALQVQTSSPFLRKTLCDLITRYQERKAEAKAQAHV